VRPARAEDRGEKDPWGDRSAEGHTETQRRREKMKISDIDIGERHRKDMGDIDALADSIRTVGLLHPVVIDADGKLIAGARRIAAVKMLGRDSIDARVAESVTAAAILLQAERDENTCRKDFSPGEAVAVGQALEAIERPAAKQRQRDHGGTAPGRRKNTSGTWPEVSTGDTRDKVAAAVGMSGKCSGRRRWRPS